MTDSIFRHFVLIAFVIYWSVVLIMIRKWWGGRHLTISLHASTNATTRKLFAVLVILETILYLLFLFKWFIPYYGMPYVFGVLVILTLGGHFVAGIIPETRGLSKTIHRWASYWSVALFVPELIIIGMTPSISPIVRTIALVFSVVLIWAWYMFLFKYNRREDILNQALYISSLPVVLILSAYVR